MASSRGPSSSHPRFSDEEKECGRWRRVWMWESVNVRGGYKKEGVLVALLVAGTPIPDQK